MPTFKPLSDTGRSPGHPRNDHVIEQMPISQLRENPDRPHKSTPRQIKQLAAAMKELGCITPLVTDEHNMIMAGHARLEAARKNGWTHLPVIRVDQLTDTQKTLFIIADNRLAELGDWDKPKLKKLLNDLTLEIGELDIEMSGFTTGEIDLILDGPIVSLDDSDPDDVLPEPECNPVHAVRIGDLFQLGDHRLICGDARDPDIYDVLLGSTAIEMVIADAPYNVPVRGHVSGLGRVQHREFAMASGEMSREGFTQFLIAFLRAAIRHCRDGAIVEVFMDWRHMRELLDASEALDLELKNLCVWVKNNAGMGTFFRSRHELVFVFKYGSAAHINNFGLGETGRYRTNVWEFAGVNTFRRGRDEDLAAHPTVKPVTMIAEAIRDCSHRGGIVLDPFCGSGTTILAAERTGRHARCIELDPAYVEVAIERWQAKTGQQAVHAETGLTFQGLSEQRAGAETPVVTTRYRPRPTSMGTARRQEVSRG